MQKEYEVECILDYRLSKGRYLYKVKWKGYPNSDCTWQPETNLTYCQEIIKDFKVRKGLCFKKQLSKEALKSRYPIHEIDSPEESDNDSSEKDKNSTNILKKTLGVEDKQQISKYVTVQQSIDQGDLQANTKPQVRSQNPEQSISPSDDITIMKMLRDSQNDIYYRVKQGNAIEIFSRSQIIKDNLKALLDFYDKFVNIKTKNCK